MIKLRLTGALATIALTASLAMAEETKKPPTPATPATPAAGAKPATPATPATPAKAGTPATPAKPATPATPAAATKPAAPAAPAVPMVPAKPPEQNALFAVFKGNWRCTGTLTDLMGGKHAYKATVNAKPVLSNMWWQGTYTQAKTKEWPGFTAVAFMGWDEVSKKYVFSGTDSWGGSASLTSAGSTKMEEPMVWSGDGIMMGQKMNMKYTFAFTGPKELHVTLDANGKNLLDDVCKK